eukprot:CAMPEP_0197539460 /NCGR_PEP_ID=MMETSP1318-20131121/62789_1 /TAXON_ID=552666 /ORGANISM="Partenskyella glossopodia, Strain RCC365" /LENGTH=238 /DNA_ID=CAMNT_0043098183 /DNA_START=400 /DNA_END=1116 /DNA_ORIENTATION=-
MMISRMIKASSILVVLLMSLVCFPTIAASEITKTSYDGVEAAPAPPIWPTVFHAVLYQNRSNDLAIVDLYYEYPKGRNLNLIRSQHDYDKGSQGALWDVEFDNHTSFYYHPAKKTCMPMKFPVGILVPNWLENATFLGVEETDKYKCNVWTKADGFITYWEEVTSRKPVKWIFGSGMEEHILKWTVNETLPDEHWQTPSYCFKNSTSNTTTTSNIKLQQQTVDELLTFTRFAKMSSSS